MKSPDTLSRAIFKQSIRLYTRRKHTPSTKGNPSRVELFFLRFAASLALENIKRHPERPPTDTYTIHTLLQHMDVSHYIIGLHSFLRFLKTFPAIIVYDDGTLTPPDIRLLSVIPRLTVVSSSRMNETFHKTFSETGAVAQYRRQFIRTRKIIDLVFFKERNKKILLFDSDLGFFKEPRSLLSFLYSPSSQTKILYMSDIQDAYATTRTNLRHIYGITITPKVNCGLLGVTPNIISKRFIKYFFTRLDRYKNTYPYFSEWVDQTPWAVLTKLHASKRLSSLYYIGMKETPPGVICRHYVHGSRSYFIKDMLRLIDNPQP